MSLGTTTRSRPNTKIAPALLAVPVSNATNHVRKELYCMYRVIYMLKILNQAQCTFFVTSHSIHSCMLSLHPVPAEN